MNRLDFSTLRLDGLMAREWLATNGNGGYASSTLCSINTRKYHGLLVASLAPPVRRMVLLSRVEETIICTGRSFDLAANEYPGVIHPTGHSFLRAFSNEPFPRWAYQGEGWTIEKQLRPLRGQNAVVLTYALLAGTQAVELELRPLFALRPMHELMYQWTGQLDAQQISAGRYRIPATSRTPEVFFSHDGGYSAQPCWYLNTIYRREQERGYAGLEDLWMPGVARWTLTPGQTAHFVCSLEPIELVDALREAQRQAELSAAPVVVEPPADPAMEALLRAADQFAVRTREGTTMLMASYPWSPPHGRDALIALPGLLLATGRLDEARSLLTNFAGTIQKGLMPADLAEDGSGWRYTAADTSLWFVNAVHEYLRYGGDAGFVANELLGVIHQIIEAYRGGTDLGIGIDGDGLLKTHAPGIPTTWMDAKAGDWVITPRQGRPVSLNALWYNALRIDADLSGRFGHAERVEELTALAERAKEAFNRRFWHAEANCCYDVVEDHGNDPSVRPNQLLAISLAYPVLAIERHAAVVEKVRSELLTPVGVRTLSPHDPSYQGHYGGPVVARDRAYHQGSAFPWLLGPLVTAYLRVHGRGQAARAEAMHMLEGCFDYLLDEGLGQLCELFDGDPPHHPGGALASARSVAEVLRCYAEDVLGVTPAGHVTQDGSRPASISSAIPSRR